MAMWRFFVWLYFFSRSVHPSPASRDCGGRVGREGRQPQGWYVIGALVWWDRELFGHGVVHNTGNNRKVKYWTYIEIDIYDAKNYIFLYDGIIIYLIILTNYICKTIFILFSAWCFYVKKPTFGRGSSLPLSGMPGNEREASVWTQEGEKAPHSLKMQ